MKMFNFSKIRKSIVMVAAVVALLVPMAVSAGFGPSRPIKDWNVPADRVGFDHVVFNSFINTPYWGDERAFFDGKIATENDSSFRDPVNGVKDGDEVTLRVYVHNNGNDGLNATGQTVAQNTKVRIALPSNTGTNLQATSYISADNAQPQTVFDTANISGNSAFSLAYVPGSAQIATGAMNIPISDSIVTTGAPIGYDQLNGRVPGCFQYQALVFIKVRVVKAPAPPVFVCKELKGEAQNSGSPLTMKFTATPEVSQGVTVQSYIFKYGDGTPDVESTNNMVSHTYEKPGTYEASVLIKTSAGITAPADACKLRITVKEDQPPVITPVATVETPTEIANTGPTAVAGMLGIGSLGWAVNSFLRSRKSLLNALLKR